MLDQDVFFAASEDVVIHKIVAGRLRDVEDVRGILLKTQDIDMAYIKKWLNDFSTGLEDDAIKERLENVLITIKQNCSI